MSRFRDQDSDSIRGKKEPSGGPVESWEEDSLDPLLQQAFKQRLERRLEELEHLDARIQDSVELDQSRVGRLSRVDALQIKAMEEASARRRSEERRRIYGALRRIEEGDYGLCIDCEELIPLGRLEIDPSLPRCVLCAD